MWPDVILIVIVCTSSVAIAYTVRRWVPIRPPIVFGGLLVVFVVLGSLIRRDVNLDRTMGAIMIAAAAIVLLEILRAIRSVKKG